MPLVVPQLGSRSVQARDWIEGWEEEQLCLVPRKMEVVASGDHTAQWCSLGSDDASWIGFPSISELGPAALTPQVPVASS